MGDNKGSKHKNEKKDENSIENSTSVNKLNDLNKEIDLGDADDSSGSLGMDNFRTKADKEKLPSEKGRIEEL